MGKEHKKKQSEFINTNNNIAVKQKKLKSFIVKGVQLF